MREKIRVAAMVVSAFVIWFSVVMLGFGSQLWPLLAGAR
jgi:hypothetical protein